MKCDECGNEMKFELFNKIGLNVSPIFDPLMFKLVAKPDHVTDYKMCGMCVGTLKSLVEMLKASRGNSLVLSIYDGELHNVEFTTKETTNNGM